MVVGGRKRKEECVNKVNLNKEAQTPSECILFNIKKTIPSLSGIKASGYPKYVQRSYI